MKKNLFLVLVLLTLPPLAFSQNREIFSLDFSKDVGIAAGSLSLFATSQLLDFTIEKSPGSQVILVNENIPLFDRWSAKPFNPQLDKFSDIFTLALLATPALLSIQKTPRDILTLGILYSEALLTTWSIKSFAKAVITRHRPYCYFENPSEHYYDEESSDSFFSSQTAMAFTSAAFITSVFHTYSVSKGARFFVTASAFTAASAVAVLRVISGSHFASDVLIGAAVGSLSGFLIPCLHKKSESNDLEIAIFSDEEKDFSLSVKISL